MSQNSHYYHEIRQSLFILVVNILKIQILISLIDFAFKKYSEILGIHDFYMGYWEFLFSHVLNTILLLWIVLKWANKYYVINLKEISITLGILYKTKCSYEIEGIQSSESFIEMKTRTKAMPYMSTQDSG